MKILFKTRLGNPDAQYNLAVFYTHGLGGLDQDTAKAKQLLKKAAKGISMPTAILAEAFYFSHVYIYNLYLRSLPT